MSDSTQVIHGVPLKLVQDTINYLAGKPWGEVTHLMSSWITVMQAQQKTPAQMHAEARSAAEAALAAKKG